MEITRDLQKAEQARALLREQHQHEQQRLVYGIGHSPTPIAGTTAFGGGTVTPISSRRIVITSRVSQTPFLPSFWTRY
jgi:hypothetical protein